MLGDLDISTETDDARPAVYRIVRVYNHPDYESSSHYNDISLFELETTVAMGPYVRPACLHTSITNSQTIATSGYEINGWGRTHQGRSTEYYTYANYIATEVKSLSSAQIQFFFCSFSNQQYVTENKNVII